MHPLAKLLIGVLFLVIPLGLYAYEFMYKTSFSLLGINFNLLGSLRVVLQGMIPPFLILIGLFIVWLELDELRIERELRAEEAKTTKRRGRKRKKKK